MEENINVAPIPFTRSHSLFPWLPVGLRRFFFLLAIPCCRPRAGAAPRGTWERRPPAPSMGRRDFDLITWGLPIIGRVRRGSPSFTSRLSRAELTRDVVLAAGFQ